MTVLVLLGGLPPELRYAVQFCPGCRRRNAPDEYLLCARHSEEASLR